MKNGDHAQRIEKERVKIHECKNTHCNRRISRSDREICGTCARKKKEMKKNEQ